MIPNKEDRLLIDQQIKDYDITNSVLDKSLKCPLFPNIDLYKVCKLLWYTPHPAQVYVINNMKRFTIANIWRQRWKSDIAAITLIAALMSKDNWKFMIVSADSSAATMIVDKVLLIASKFPKEFNYKKKENILEYIPTNSRAYIKTPINPKWLVWLTLDWLIIDEAAEIPENIWQQKLKATITVKRWWVLFTSTPLTENDWFYQLFKMWQLTEWDIGYQDNYISFHFTSYDSPYQDLEYLEQEKKTTTEVFYNQQYLAMPLQDAWEVFKNIIVNATWEFRDAEKWKRRYLIWWDLAKSLDYSWIVVIDRKDNNICHMERLNWDDYIDQINLILDLSEKYNQASIFMDSSTKWDPVLEFLRAEARKRKLPIYIKWIVWTALNKWPMVKDLMLAMEQNKIKYPKDEILLKEFEDYRVKVNSNWNLQYAAKKHSTDDMVSALIMWWQWILTFWEYKDRPVKKIIKKSIY